MENKLLKLKELDSFIKTIEGVHSCCSEICFDENNCCTVICSIRLCCRISKLSIIVDYIGRADIKIECDTFGSSYLYDYVKQLLNIDKNINHIINKALDVIEA